MKLNSHFVIAVIGPTAVGKSDFAVALARQLGGEIISADSRQVYKGMDIGTGKITKREMKGIPHYLLDITTLSDDPHKQFSVSEFKTLAEAKIEEILKRGKVPIICGGTGLYVDTLLSGSILPEVPPNKKLRDSLAKKSAPQLLAILKKLDKSRAKTVEQNNPVRLIRAIEIARALGKVPKVTMRPRWPTLYIGLDTSDAQLRSNIHQRLIKRMKRGMVQEVAHLKGRGLSWKRLEQLGLEYRYCALLLQKKMTTAEMIEKLEREIWQYAKRQRTWWKRNKDIIWVR